MFLGDHPIAMWDANELKFPYIGRLEDDVSFQDFPDELKLDVVAREFGTVQWLEGNDDKERRRNKQQVRRGGLWQPRQN